VKFLVDAHLPRGLCAALTQNGHELHGRPWKLLLVKTGNISARDLRALFERNLPAIEAAFQTHTLVEVDRMAVTLVA